MIRTEADCYETFDVRGDDQTISVTTVGVIWDLRDQAGRPVTRAVGVLYEPHQGTPTFTGSVIKKGVRRYFVNAPADTMLGSDDLLALACDAAVR